MTVRLTLIALLRKVPLLTATLEAACFASLAGFFLANALRVDLSYQPVSSARDALMARYQLGESVCSSLTVWPAFFGVLPLIVVQLSACAWTPTREIVTAGRWATRLLVISTLVGTPSLLFLALLCSLSLGAGMIG